MFSRRYKRTFRSVVALVLRRGVFSSLCDEGLLFLLNVHRLLMAKTTYSFETSATTYPTTQDHIPDDRNLGLLLPHNSHLGLEKNEGHYPPRYLPYVFLCILSALP